MPAVQPMHSATHPKACGLSHDTTISLMSSPSLASAAALHYYPSAVLGACLSGGQGARGLDR